MTMASISSVWAGFLHFASESIEDHAGKSNHNESVEYTGELHYIRLWFTDLDLMNSRLCTSVTGTLSGAKYLIVMHCKPKLKCELFSMFSTLVINPKRAQCMVSLFVFLSVSWVVQRYWLLS